MARDLEKKREYDRKYCKEHKRDPEKNKEGCKRYRQKNKDKIKEYLRTHKKDRGPYDRKRYLLKKETIDRQRKEYYHSHKKEIAIRRKKYRLLHKDANAAYKRKYRAARLMVGENYTTDDNLFTMHLFSGQCFNCGTKEKLTIDHVYPLSKGYALTRSNACVLCRKYNCSKHDKMPEDFYSEDKLKELFAILGIIEKPIPVILSHSAFSEACDSLTCSCL
jgi:5-methylcytosine-specific restriction endonuclease McrA